eukprot:7251869-Alexandrium_andersonii.AAC.1
MPECGPCHHQGLRCTSPARRARATGRRGARACRMTCFPRPFFTTVNTICSALPCGFVVESAPPLLTAQG